MNVPENGWFFPIPREGAGAVSLGPRPQADALELWCEAAEQAGISHVVSMLSDSEIEAFGLASEGTALENRDIAFTRFPVLDYGTPDAPDLAALVAGLRDEMENGASIHIHCAGGRGRAGTMACCILVGDGLEAAEAVAQVSAARGISVPENDKQLNFVNAFANG